MHSKYYFLNNNNLVIIFQGRSQDLLWGVMVGGPRFYDDFDRFGKVTSFMLFYLK